MNTNIILTEPLIIVGTKAVEASSFYTDPTFIVSITALLITIAALCFSIIIFRPKVHIELKNVLFKQLLRSYEIVVTNNGNVMAEDIKIEFDDNLNEALNHTCPKKDEDGFGSFKFIKDNLNKEIKYLPANGVAKGLFIATEDNDENTSPLLFDVQFTIYVTYTNSITRWTYKRQPIILELKRSDWLTDYHMTDNLGYDLNRILETLTTLNQNASLTLKNQSKLVNSIEYEKLHNANTVFKSLNKTEKITILKILGEKNTEDDYLFVENLKEYIKNSNNSLSKKLGKLKLDEYNFFMTISRDFRDNV